MEYDLNIRDFWRVLRKRKHIILLTAFLMGLFSYSFATLNKPIPIYQSSATVKIEKSSTTTGLYLEALSWSGADYLETQASIITSYPILELTAKEMGLIPAELESAAIRTNSELISKVLELKGKITAEREGNSNLVNIVAQDTDPKAAQKIANTLASVYTQEHTKSLNKRTLDSRRFIEKQLEDVSQKLSNAEENVRSFREEYKLISLDTQTSRLLGDLANTETEYLNITKSIEQLEYMVDRLNAEKIQTITTKDSFFINDASPLYTNLNNKLVTLLIDKDSLLLTFTEKHPKIVEIDSQLAEIATNMQAILIEKLATLKKVESKISGQIKKLQDALSTLPDRGLVLARLERDVKFNEKIYQLLQEKLQEAKIMEAAKVEEAYIVKPALETRVPINRSQVKLKAIAGVIIGIVIGGIIAFVYETFDTSIGAIHEVESFAQVPVLGVIPEIDTKEVKNFLVSNRHLSKPGESDIENCTKLITHYMPQSVAAENYRAIRTNVHFARLGQDIKTLAFTSSVPGEGKTTTVINTAIAMAQSQNKVLLIEADLRKPNIYEWFGVERQPGLSEVIIGSYKWQDAVKSVIDLMLGQMDFDEVLLTPGLDYLNIMTAGNIPHNPAELITSNNFFEFFEEVKKEYDIICIDIPPVLSVADAAIVSSRVDGVVVVYQVGRTSRDSLKRSLDQLSHVHANVMGIVLNGIKSDLSPDYEKFAGNKYQSYNKSYLKMN